MTSLVTEFQLLESIQLRDLETLQHACRHRGDESEDGRSRAGDRRAAERKTKGPAEREARGPFASLAALIGLW
jgi:hypothetical protein